MNLGNVIWAAIVPWLVPIGLAAGTILAMYVFNKKKTDTNYLKTALTIIKAMFGSKLGDKADAIFSIWLECLDKVKNGTWTQEQMLTEFFKIIEQVGPTKLTDNEVAEIKQITDTSVKLLNIDTKVSLMSVNLK